MSLDSQAHDASHLLRQAINILNEVDGAPSDDAKKQLIQTALGFVEKAEFVLAAKMIVRPMTLHASSRDETISYGALSAGGGYPYQTKVIANTRLLVDASDGTEVACWPHTTNDTKRTVRIRAFVSDDAPNPEYLSIDNGTEAAATTATIPHNDAEYVIEPS